MAKKIPIPRAKTKLSAWDKFYAGIAGLSPFTGRSALHQSRSTAMPSGQAAHAAHRANLLAKYGKWGSRGLRWSGLTNPWTAVPYALMAGADYAVGKSFDPYRDETGKIGTEGYARLAMEARAREDLAARRRAGREEGLGFRELAKMRKQDMDLEPFLKAQQELELNRPTYTELKARYPDRGPKKEDLWHKGLFWRNRGPESFSPGFLNEGGIARLL